MTGFRLWRQTGIVLEVGQALRSDVQMQLGSVAEPVNVMAEVSPLNTEKGAVKGDVIVHREIHDLPPEGRDFVELAFLTPGVVPMAQGGNGCFKKSTRTGITLGVSASLEIDMRMEVGALAESVSVTAEAPMLDTNVVSSGRLLENRSLMDLPVLGNNIILLAKMSPGIQHGSGANNYVGLHSNPTANSKGGAEGNVGGSEWSIDGMPNSGSDRKTARDVDDPKAIRGGARPDF